MVDSSSGSGSRSASPAVLAALRELQEDYGKVLPGLVEKLAGAVREARDQMGDAARLEAVRAQAHKLRGTAGSYGFRGVSEAAARLEQATQRALDEPGEERWDALQAAVAEMEAAATEGAEHLPFNG
jgi:HPt (histidine-containing phosphotransfer) domain-containing protein